jgi:hypothetical protein
VRIRLLLYSSFLVILLLLNSCWTLDVGVNKFYPEDREYAPREIATLIVAYPLKPISFDGKEVKEVGGSNTMIEMLPGDHTIVTFADTRTSQMEEGYYEFSGSVTNRFRAQAGWFYFLSIDCIYCEQFITFIRGGPHPFKTGAGHLITIDIRNGIIFVEKGGVKTQYSVPLSCIYYSPDSRHLAFKTKKDKWMVVRDGIEEESFDESYVGIAWSMDGKHFAHRVGNECGFLGCNEYYVIMDGKRLGPYKRTRGKFFFDTRGRIIYGAEQDDGWYFMRGREAVKMDNEYEVDVAIDDAYAEYLKALNISP